MGDDDATPLNSNTDVLYVEDANALPEDPAGAVLVALRDLAPGEELLFENALPDAPVTVLEADTSVVVS